MIMRPEWRFPILKHCIDYSNLGPPSFLADYSMIDIDFYERTITLPEGKFDLRQVLLVMKRIDELLVEHNSR